MAKSVQENNAAARRSLAVVNSSISAIDSELGELLEKYLAGKVTALYVKIREIKLREQRAEFEAIRKSLLGAIKHF